MKTESNGEELYRRCRVCKQSKPLSEFSRDKTKRFGRRSICRRCKREADKNYYTKNRKNILEYYRNSYILHSDERKEYQRKYRILHPKRVKERKRRYNQTPQGRLNHNLAAQRRRARKVDAGGDGITKEQIGRIRKRQKNRCNICGKKFTRTYPYTLDHIVPLAVGGAHDSNNIQLLCKTCNSSKYTHMDPQFIQTWNHNT